MQFCVMEDNAPTVAMDCRALIRFTNGVRA